MTCWPIPESPPPPATEPCWSSSLSLTGSSYMCGIQRTGRLVDRTFTQFCLSGRVHVYWPRAGPHEFFQSCLAASTSSWTKMCTSSFETVPTPVIDLCSLSTCFRLQSKHNQDEAVTSPQIIVVARLIKHEGECRYSIIWYRKCLIRYACNREYCFAMLG